MIPDHLNRAGDYLRDYEESRYTFKERTFRVLDTVRSILVPVDAEEFFDVSFWQAGMDWDEYARHARGVILRIGQGTWEDTEFEYNYTNAKRVGVAVGGYLFYDDRVSPEQQAQMIIDAMRGKIMEMEILIDYERKFGGAYWGLRHVKRLVEILEAAGVRCFEVGAYSGYYFWLENTRGDEQYYPFFAARPLWLAWYAAASLVRVPLPWTNWTHWQDGTPAIDVGQPTIEIDHNRHNGTPEQFRQRYLGATVPPPPGGNMTKYEVIGAQGLNLRTGPGTSFNVIRLVPTGSFVWGVLQSSGWIQGTKFQELGGAELTQNFYCSGVVTLVREVTATVPDSITIDITAHDVKTPGDKYQATGIALQKVG